MIFLKKKKLANIYLLCCIWCITLYTTAQPRPHNRPAEQIESYQGNIIQWESNNDFVYHAFIFETDNKETLFVKFPAYLGSEIYNLGNKNLQINGFFRKNKDKNNVFQLISIASEDKEVSKTNRGYKRPHPRAKDPVQIQGNGKIKKIICNDRNDPVAYLLANDTLLKMPPHIFRQINNVAKVGTEVNYEGLERKLNTGELQEKRKIIIHARAIEINGTRYFIQ